MALRSRTGTMWQRSDCLAAERRASGVKILWAVSGTRAAISGAIEVPFGSFSGGCCVFLGGLSEGFTLRASQLILAFGSRELGLGT